MDRIEASRALARVFAYLGCGHIDRARTAAQPLIEWLRSL
jgi:hypothetical protein